MATIQAKSGIDYDTVTRETTSTGTVVHTDDFVSGLYDTEVSFRYHVGVVNNDNWALVSVIYYAEGDAGGTALSSKKLVQTNEDSRSYIGHPGTYTRNYFQRKFGVPKGQVARLITSGLESNMSVQLTTTRVA